MSEASDCMNTDELLLACPSPLIVRLNKRGDPLLFGGGAYRRSAGRLDCFLAVECDVEARSVRRFFGPLHKPASVVNCLAVESLGLWAVCSLSGDVSVLDARGQGGGMQTVYWGKQVRRDEANTNRCMTVCGSDVVVVNSRRSIDVIRLGRSAQSRAVVRRLEPQRRFREVAAVDDLLLAVDDSHLFVFDRLSRYRLLAHKQLLADRDELLQDLAASSAVAYVAARSSLFAVRMNSLGHVAHRAGRFERLAGMLAFRFKNLQLLVVTYYHCSFDLFALVQGALCAVETGVKAKEPRDSVLHTVLFDEKKQRLLFSGDKQMFSLVNLLFD